MKLQDAGDFIEDANFVFDMADAAILRLYNLLGWVKEMMVMRENQGLRTGEDHTFADQVFENEMNKAIRMTSESYEQTLFKEALKTGFYEYQVHSSSLFFFF